MSKIDKLKDAVIRGDKSRFIQNIFNFSKKDIIGLTEQEFKEVLECCSKIEFNGIQEFSNFLLEEGIQAFIIPEDKHKTENLFIARFYYSIFLIFPSKHYRDCAWVSIELGKVYRILAELGIESKTNLEQSAKLIQF